MSSQRKAKCGPNDGSGASIRAEREPVHTFTRAGSTIHYWSVGEPGGPTVVLTHGLNLDHGTYAGQVPVLRDAGYRVITWDLRGHGLSQPMGERFSVDSTAEDLAVLLEEAGVEGAVLVAQSFGGLVALELYRRSPERAAGLVLVGTPTPAERIPWYQQVLQRVNLLGLRLVPEKYLRRMLPTFMSRREDVRRYVARTSQALSKADMFIANEAVLEGLQSAHPLERLDVDVLLICGEGETAIIARMMRAWAERDGRVRLEVVDNAGHLVNQEEPVACNEVLLGFLRQRLPVDG